ncbi:MAG: flaCE [Phenylobacterium sp.]|nr:flaCE [Phenylobacterium sp.]
MPGGNFDADQDEDLDAQDQAETFDESNVVGGEGDSALGDESPVSPASDMRTFEELPDVEDLTQAAGDRDDDEALALDADEFDEEAIGDGDLEEDNELDYHAATEEHEDDLDGLGPEDGFNEDRLDTRSEIDGLAEEVADADQVSGGEDDFTNFQSKNLDNDDLKRLGYSEDRGGETRAKPERR